MESQRARRQYLELLFDSAWAAKYPSPNFLDRIEGRLRNREDAMAFVELLVDKAGRKYHSPNIVDRLDRVIARMEKAEATAALSRQLQQQEQQD